MLVPTRHEAWIQYALFASSLDIREFLDSTSHASKDNNKVKGRPLWYLDRML